MQKEVGLGYVEKLVNKYQEDCRALAVAAVILMSTLGGGSSNAQGHGEQVFEDEGLYLNCDASQNGALVLDTDSQDHLNALTAQIEDYLVETEVPEAEVADTVRMLEQLFQAPSIINICPDDGTGFPGAREIIARRASSPEDQWPNSNVLQILSNSVLRPEAILAPYLNGGDIGEPLDQMLEVDVQDGEHLKQATILGAQASWLLDPVFCSWSSCDPGETIIEHVVDPANANPGVVFLNFAATEMIFEPRDGNPASLVTEIYDEVIPMLTERGIVPVIIGMPYHYNVEDFMDLMSPHDRVEPEHRALTHYLHQLPKAVRMNYGLMMYARENRLPFVNFAGAVGRTPSLEYSGTKLNDENGPNIHHLQGIGTNGAGLVEEVDGELIPTSGESAMNLLLLAVLNQITSEYTAVNSAAGGD